jgi:hypothetical protein
MVMVCGIATLLVFGALMKPERLYSARLCRYRNAPNKMECVVTESCGGIIRHAALCAVGREGTDYLFTPFGHLADGNPYDAYLPPVETLPGQSPA